MDNNLVLSKANKSTKEKIKSINSLYLCWMWALKYLILKWNNSTFHHGNSWSLSDRHLNTMAKDVCNLMTDFTISISCHCIFTTGYFSCFGIINVYALSKAEKDTDVVIEKFW